MSLSNPTNRELMAELKTINGRIVSLEQWKIARDAADSAIEKYKIEDIKRRRTGYQESYEKSRLQIMAEISPLIAALIILIYAVAQRLSH